MMNFPQKTISEKLPFYVEKSISHFQALTPCLLSQIENEGKENFLADFKIEQNLKMLT